MQDDEYLVAEQVVLFQDHAMNVRISHHRVEEFWRVGVTNPGVGLGHISTTVAAGDSFMMNLIDEALGGAHVAWQHLAQWGHANLTRPARGRSIYA